MKTTLQKQFAVSLLTFILSLLVFFSTAQTVQTFTSSGTWVCPFGVTSITVETWGGGGAGGAAVNSPGVGGGGGGGAYLITTLVPVTFGTSYSYIVGAGGIGNITGVVSNGAASSFNGTYVANFGLGGGSGPATGTAGLGGTGGTFNGGNGALGSYATLKSGGGGGGAGSGGNGGSTLTNVAGIGGAIDGGAGGTGVTTNTIGGNAIVIGGGGAGALRNGGGGAKKGGDGARGQVRITYTINCTAPPAQPTGLILTPSFTSISGSFTAAAFTDGYIVIRTATAVAPTSPVNGTTYIAGTSALGGYIETVGTATTFNSISLTGTTQYWYWVYGYNNVACVGGIKYLTTSPLNGSAITLTCGVPLNKAIITTPGTNTYNFSTLAWSLGHIPNSCENAEIVLNISTGTTSDVVTVVWDVDFSCVNMTLTNSCSDAHVHIFQTNGTRTINILGDLFMRSPGTNRFNRSVFSNQTLTNIYGNLTLGNPVQGALDGHAAIGSNGSTPNQTYVLYGNMTFNPRGYTTDEWTKFIFDKAGTQIITNNTVLSDTTQPVLFENLRIGNTNATTVIFAGTTPDGYIENVRAAGITIGVNSTLDLPANYSFTKFAGGFAEPLIMLAGSKLRLGGDKTISANGTISSVISGSNFPTNFSPYTFDPTSTIEYYGSNAITQTIYNGVTYANLITTNGSGSGRAQKITTAPVTVNTTFNINALADVTLGLLGSSAETVSSVGPLNINATGGLYCNANVVSGAGAFTMGNGSYLGMGHAQGISLLGNATGNIQMTGARNFNTTGNYIYNGIVTQVTGGGLPTTINDLTIDNPTTVTIATNQLVNGVDLLKQGTFDIGVTKITHNALSTISSVTGKMKADVGTVEMKGTTGIAQNLSGNWFVNKTISSLINANSKGITIAAAPADTLLISTEMYYGAVTNSAITTNDNLTLLSRSTVTARFGEIVNASGNTITGKINIERYLFARKSWRLLAAPVANGTSPFITASWRESGSLASTGYGTQITGPAGYTGMDATSQRASLKSWNASSNVYVDVTNTNSTKISNAQGYYVFVRGDRAVPVTGAAAATNLRIKGDILTGDQIFTVPTGKFQTFGNPYPSRIDFRTVTKSSVTTSFIIWNPNSLGSYNVGAFETYTFDGTNYLKVPGGTIRNFIESGEAVFVQSNGGAGTITVKESDKVSGSAAVSRSSTESRGGITNPTLEINMYAKDVDGSTYLADGVLLNFDDSYSNIVDNMDVRKISNTADNLAIRNGNLMLVVERRPGILVNDTIKMNLANTHNGPYRFEIDPSVLNYPNVEAVLNDKFLGTNSPVSLSAITNYIFDITADVASRVADRFMITFKQVPPMRFTNITAVRNADNTATIQWNTENENNINYYTIEHSVDAINFISVTQQLPTANNFGNPYYNFLHAGAVAGNNWYRVKSNAINGSSQYTSIVKVGAVAIVEMPSISINPNPATDGIVNVYFTNKPTGDYQIKISNNLGQTLHVETIHLQITNLQKTIKLNAAIGSYQITIIDGETKNYSIPFLIK